MPGIEDTFIRSTRAWRNKPALAVPFILNAILQFLLIAAVLLASAFIVFPLVSPSPQIPTQDALTGRLNLTFLASVCVLAAMYLLASSLSSSYFTGAAIAMCAGALDLKKQRESAWRLALGRLTALFLANMLILLAYFIITIPAMGLSVMMYLAEPTGGFSEFGYRCMILSVFLFSVLFTAAPYAIVLGGTGPLEGLKESLDLLRRETIPYLVLWSSQYFIVQILIYAAFLMGAAAFAAGLLFVPLPPLQSLLPVSEIGDSLTYAVAPLSYAFLAACAVFFIAMGAINLLILSPLFTLCWTIFYRDRTGRQA